MSTVRNSGFFSSKYIAQQIATYKTCDAEIRALDINEYEECGCSAADLVQHCDFMLYYNWLYHQGEETKDILIKESKVADNSATVVMELLSKKGNTKGYQTVTVTLDNENGKWKISDIANGR